MASQLANQGRGLALKTVLFQLAVVLVAAFIAGVWGFHYAVSLIVGGLISVIPNSIMIYKVFQHTGAQAVREVMKGFYIGEALKFFLTIVLFAIVLKWVPVVASACLIGFLLAVLAQLSAPFVVKTT